MSRAVLTFLCNVYEEYMLLLAYDPIFMKKMMLSPWGRCGAGFRPWKKIGLKQDCSFFKQLQYIILTNKRKSYKINIKVEKKIDIVCQMNYF
jgi:hypothetical protein